MIEEHNKDGEAWPDTFIETVEDHTKDGEALPDTFIETVKEHKNMEKPCPISSLKHDNRQPCRPIHQRCGIYWIDGAPYREMQNKDSIGHPIV